MKSFIVIGMFLLISINALGQRFTEVVKWEGYTKNDGKVVGISPSKDEANQIMLDFNERNKDSDYEIVGMNFKYSTIPLERKGEDIFNTFRSEAYKGYKVLSKEDVIALQIIDEGDLGAGVKYYVSEKVNEEEEVVKRRLKNLYKIYRKYMIN